MICFITGGLVGVCYERIQTSVGIARSRNEMVNQLSAGVLLLIEGVEYFSDRLFMNHSITRLLVAQETGLALIRGHWLEIVLVDLLQ